MRTGYGLLVCACTNTPVGPDAGAAARPADAGADTGVSLPADSGILRDSGTAVTSSTRCVLVFSRTAGYRHDSIPDGIAAIQMLARDQNWSVQATEELSVFTDEQLAKYSVVVFLSTTGDVLGPDEQAAFERFVRAGGGWVGIHSASDTEYDWPFYGGLVSTYFREHPPVQEAVVVVQDATHPATAGLPTQWRRTDEWYSFKENPRPNVSVLLTLDESSYDPGTSTMGPDHPIAWFHSYDGGRAFYTALGHTRESFSEPSFLAHIAGGINWAADADARVGCSRAD